MCKDPKVIDQEEIEMIQKKQEKKARFKKNAKRFLIGAGIVAAGLIGFAGGEKHERNKSKGSNGTGYDPGYDVDSTDEEA